MGTTMSCFAQKVLNIQERWTFFVFRYGVYTCVVCDSWSCPKLFTQFVSTFTIVRMLKPHFEPNRAFCDTRRKFGTHLVWPIMCYFKTGPKPDLACGGCGSHFQNGWHEFSMSHISANNIDMKLIFVSMFSGSRNPNVAIILVCGGCSSHFQNGWHEFSMSHILANNIAL